MIDQLLLEIEKLSNNPLTIIGIDGPGGVGKTTLANELQDKLSNVQIVHMDDFDVPTNQKMRLSSNRPIGPDTRWYKVLKDVILPLRNGFNISYKRYDRSKDTSKELVRIQPKGCIIVEGVFAVRRELLTHYDLSVWVDCDFEKRVKRALGRDGEVARDLWEKDWLPMEEKYIEVYKPYSYTDLVIRTDEDCIKI